MDGDGSDRDSSLDWNQVLWWREKDSEQVLVLRSIREDDEIVAKAKDAEIKNLKDNKVYEWVSDHGQKRVSCKWVVSEKQEENGETTTKA